MIAFDHGTLNVSNESGPLGHVIDAVRNLPLDAAEVKGALDIAWINREEAHQAAIAALTAQANGQISAMQAALDAKDAQISSLISQLPE